jgi:Flp pilus assembly protein TadD
MPWNISPTTEELQLLGEAGIVLRDAGMMTEAREVFVGMQALLPRNEVPEVLLGTTRFHERQYDLAIAHYRKALAVNPRSAFAYAQLAEAQFFNNDSNEARVSLRKAVELDPSGDFGTLARNLTALLEVSTQGA